MTNDFVNQPKIQKKKDEKPKRIKQGNREQLSEKSVRFQMYVRDYDDDVVVTIYELVSFNLCMLCSITREKNEGKSESEKKMCVFSSYIEVVVAMMTAAAGKGIFSFMVIL